MSVDNLWLVILWTGLSAAALFALVRYTRVGDWIIAWILSDYGMVPTRASVAYQVGFTILSTVLAAIYSLYFYVILPSHAWELQVITCAVTAYVTLCYIRRRFRKASDDDRD